MNDQALPFDKTQVLHRHLMDNASELVDRNIIVTVDRLNGDQSVAYCSVEQRNRGFFRRTHSVIELVYRAEQALAPLHGLGILPMISVRHQDLLNVSAATTPVNRHSLMDWIQRMRGWLGYPLQREVFGAVGIGGDPFGLQRAMLVSSGS